MEQKINKLLEALLKTRVKGCVCIEPQNEIDIHLNNINISCSKCGWGEK